MNLYSRCTSRYLWLCACEEKAFKICLIFRKDIYSISPYLSLRLGYTQLTKTIKMADLEAVLADVSYLMAMEKSKSTPAARASKKIMLPDPRWVQNKYIHDITLCHGGVLYYSCRLLVQYEGKAGVQPHTIWWLFDISLPKPVAVVVISVPT